MAATSPRNSISEAREGPWLGRSRRASGCDRSCASVATAAVAAAAILVVVAQGLWLRLWLWLRLRWELRLLWW